MNQDKIEQIKVLDTLTNQSHAWKKNTSKICKSIIDLAILAENQKLRNCTSYFRNERNEVLEDENEIMSDRMHFTKHEKSKIRKYIVDSAVCCVKCFSIFKNFCSENGCTYSFIRDIYVKIVKYALKLDNGISLCAALEIYKHDWELLKHSEVQSDWFDVMNKQVIGTYMFEKCTFSLFFLLMSDMNGKKYFLTSICNQYTNNSLFLHTTEQEWTFIVDLYKNKLYKKENSDMEIDLLSFILSYLTIEGTFANDDIAKLLVSHYNSCTTEFVKFFIFKIAYLLNKKLTKPCDRFKQIFEDVLDLNHTVKIYKNVSRGIKEKLLLIQQDIFYLVDALSMFVYYECDIKFYSAAKEIRNDLVLRELYINIASLTLFTTDTSAFTTNFSYFEDILYSYATDPIYKNKGTGFVNRVAALLIDIIFDKNNVDIETKYTVLLKWNSAISKMNQTYKRQFNYSELSIFCEYCFYDLYNDLANACKKLADIHKSFVANLIRLFEKMDEKQICIRYRMYFLIITSKYTTHDYCPIDPLIIDKIVLFHAKYGFIPNTFYKLLHFLLGYPFDEQLFQQLLNLLKIKSVADSAIEICINMLQKIDVNLTKSFLVYCDRKIKHLNTDRANTLRDLLADLYNENENLGDTFEDEAMSTTSSIDSQQKSESDEDMDELQNSMKNDFGTKSDDTKSELTDSETKEVDSDSVPTKNRESTPPSVVDSSSFIVDERIDESEVIESEMSTESKNTSQSAENETCDEETQEVNDSSDECQADQDNDEETQEVNESSYEHQVDQAKDEEEEKLSSQGNEECLLVNVKSNELNYITDNRAREDIISSNKLIDNENSVHQSDSDIEEIDNSANKIYETEVTKSLPLDFFVSSENETSEKVKKLRTNGSFNTHMNVEPSKISVTPWKTANVDGIKYLSLKKKREDSPSPVIIRNSNSDRNTVPKPFATTNTCNFGALNEFTTKKNMNFDRQMMQNSYKAFNPKPLINKSSKVYIDSIKDLEDSKLRIEQPHIKIGSQIAKQDNMQEPSHTVKSTFNPYSYTKNNMLPPRQSDSNKKNVSNNADIYHAILSAKGPLKTIESKKIKFCDFESYRQYFNPLIINEILANIEKGLSEMNRNEVNFIKFSYVEKGTHLDEIYFNFDKCNLCENDAILVINKKDKNNIENVCIVKAVNNPMKIVKVLVAKENNTFSKYGDYTYCYIASLNTYFREYTAIQTLKDYSHLQDIISPVHDKEVIIDEAVKNEVQLKLNINEYQAGPVAHCVNTARRIALIQGPPGTGKTTTIVSLISAFYSGLFKFDKFGDKQRILICAPSNTAIDEVARRILKNGVKLLDDTIFMPNLLRVGVSNNISPEIRNITFEHMFEQNEIKNTHHREAERVKILNNCDIVLSTLSSSTHDCLFSIKMNFELIIVDEACQSVELSTILPLKHRHKKMVLIGDPMQLTPTTISPSQLYSMSLYQRLLNFLPIFMLGIQYRMTNLIAEFPSSHFYGGMLKTDKSCQNRISPFKAPFPEIAFVNIIGKEIRNKTNGFSNQKEVFALIKFLYTLHEQKSFTFAKNIAIITPYKTQAFLITATLKKMISEKKIDRNILKHVEINTVDAFQGQEKDLVIISTVRTKNIGFINDASRMNVMLTRAKFSVVIFGNSQFLAKDKLWMKLLCFYGANDAISSENKFMEFIENFNK